MKRLHDPPSPLAATQAPDSAAKCKQAPASTAVHRRVKMQGSVMKLRALPLAPPGTFRRHAAHTPVAAAGLQHPSAFGTSMQPQAYALPVCREAPIGS